MEEKFTKIELNHKCNLSNLLLFCKSRNYPEFITTNILEYYLDGLEVLGPENFKVTLADIKEMVEIDKYSRFVNERIPVVSCIEPCKLVYPKTREEIINKIIKLEKELNINK